MRSNGTLMFRRRPDRTIRTRVLESNANLAALSNALSNWVAMLNVFQDSICGISNL